MIVFALRHADRTDYDGSLASAGVRSPSATDSKPLLLWLRLSVVEKAFELPAPCPLRVPRTPSG